MPKSKPSIKYTSRDYDAIKQELLDYASRYYGDTVKDFSENSFASLMFETVSYIGDTLSFYLDYQVNESFFDTSNEYAFAEGIDPSQVRAAAVGSNQSSSGSGGLQTLRIETSPVNHSHNQLNDGSKKSVQAVDLFNSVFNKSGADMISIDLEISGDPDLIKQDDVWLPPGAARNTSSLLMDKKQLFMRLNFKIPKDINLSTGLYEFETKNSAFSGIYTIIRVENTFNNGVFKQKLKCVRLFDQPADTQNKQVSREASNPNRSVTNPTLGTEDRESGIDPAFTEDEYGEGGELIGGDPDAASSIEESVPQTDFELANADIQSWPEEFASEYNYPGI